MDLPRLIAELKETGANNYNWLIGAPNDWDDLKQFLPLAAQEGISVWVSVLPPSESRPHSNRYSEPFRLDYEKWAGELAALSRREPTLVAWSIDDFAHNLETFTPDRMERIIARQRGENPEFAFVPCVYYRQATPVFADVYRNFFDGILFPYRSESGKIGFDDPEKVPSEVQTLKNRFGEGFPIVVDVYATRHSRLGPSTPEFVERVMEHAYDSADGVHIYCHQNKLDAEQREKYELIRSLMSSWDVQRKVGRASSPAAE